MYIYAELNNEGTAFAISELCGEVNKPTMILLASQNDNGIIQWENEISKDVDIGWRFIKNKWLEPLLTSQVKKEGV